jgi:hypothetical protein
MSRGLGDLSLQTLWKAGAPIRVPSTDIYMVKPIQYITLIRVDYLPIWKEPSSR